MTTDRWLTLRELARHLNRPLRLLQAWVDAGKLPVRAVLTPVKRGYAHGPVKDRGLQFGKPEIVYSLQDAAALDEGCDA